MKTFIVLLIATALSGCLTTPPALGGKTKYSMKFQDTVSEIRDETGVITSPGQDTQFMVNIAAAAGVDVKDLASMRYKVNPDGTVDIAVASQPAVDTTAQAQALVQAHQTTMETVKALAPVIADVVTQSILLPGASTGADDAPAPPLKREVTLSRVLTGLQSLGVGITVEQANALADILGVIRP